MKLTPIFPPNIKPLRKGVYKTWFTGAGITYEGYSYWLGNKWSMQTKTIADDQRYFIGSWTPAEQNKRWQGVLK